MTLRWVIVVLTLALCACASGGTEGVGQGDANYDALKAATETCVARGGELRLKGSYDARQLSSYECKLGAAK